MSTEAQKRASRNYYLKHKEYYSKKSGEYVKNMRKEKSDYKERIDKAIEYIQNENNITKHGIYPNYTYEVDTKDLLNILQNESEEK